MRKLLLLAGLILVSCAQHQHYLYLNSGIDTHQTEHITLFNPNNEYIGQSGYIKLEQSKWYEYIHFDSHGTGAKIELKGITRCLQCNGKGMFAKGVTATFYRQLP